MCSSKSLNISLPHDMAQMVRDKVAAGEYATESDVVRHGLSVLQARDAVVERWLRTEVVESCKDMAADPSAAISVEDVLERIESRREKAFGS